jgi:hypothetical protein
MSSVDEERAKEPVNRIGGTLCRQIEGNKRAWLDVPYLNTRNSTKIVKSEGGVAPPHQ